MLYPSPSQWLELTVPVAKLLKDRLIVTMESQPFAAPPARVSVPVGLFSSYTVPFTMMLLPVQSVCARVAVAMGLYTRLIVTTLSQPLLDVRVSVPVGLPSLYTVPFTLTEWPSPWQPL